MPGSVEYRTGRAERLRCGDRLGVISVGIEQLRVPAAGCAVQVRQAVAVGQFVEQLGDHGIIVAPLREHGVSTI